jgi:hypothetical protein
MEGHCFTGDLERKVMFCFIRGQCAFGYLRDMRKNAREKSSCLYRLPVGGTWREGFFTGNSESRVRNVKEGL